jgi:hypothetical protein
MSGRPSPSAIGISICRNANISQHNPGMDANTFYVSVSRFRTKGIAEGPPHAFCLNTWG